MSSLRRLSAILVVSAFSAATNAAPPTLAWAVTTSSPPPLDIVENGFLNVPDVGPRSAMDSAGNLFVAATTFGSQTCAVILKYSGGDGSIAWRRDICPGFTGALALDSAGDVLLAGASSSDALVAKLSGADGTTVWQQIVPASTNHAAGALSIGVDGANDARVAVHDTGGILTVYGFQGGDGTLQWLRPLADPLGDDKMNAFAVAGNGSSVLQDFLTDDNNQSQSRLTLLDNFGSIVWQIDAHGGPLAFAPDGNVIASRSPGTVKRSAATGEILWSQSVGGAIAVDGLGNVYVGSSIGPESDSDIATYKITPDGTLAWSNVLVDSTNRGFSNAIALDPQGNPVVAALATTTSGASPQPTIKYSADDGHVLWIGTDADSSTANFSHEIRAGASGAIELGSAFQGSTRAGLRLVHYTDVPASGARADPAISLASSANPSAAGQSVTFVANITGSAGAASGTVDFLDGISVIPGCSAVPVSSGSAPCTTSTLVAGNHTIIATYSGDAGYNSDSAPALAQTVNAATKATPTMGLFGPPNGGAPGQSAFFNAVVSGNAANGFPTGTVAFFDGTTVIPGCEAVRLAGGSSTTSGAACSTTSLAIGMHTINAQYAGSFAYNPASASTTIDVENAPPATVSFTSSKNPSAQGEGVTFTWTLEGSTGKAPPTGTADFLDGTSVIAGCAAVPLAGSAVACTTSALLAGSHSITARYSGDSNYNTTTTAFTINQTVQPAGSAALALNPASIAFGGESMGTTSPPQSISVTNTTGTTVTISGITASAQFAQSNNCSSLAPGASCTISVTFNPAAAAVALNSTVAVSGTVTVSSNAPGSPDSVSLAGSAEKSLVTHYYRSILRRAPDSSGKAFWQGEAARVASLGGDVNETWCVMALVFYASSEYAAFGRDDAGFVTDLYNTFFNRAPDADGLAFWTGQIAQGMPRGVVLVSFMFSTEFQNFTRAIFGNTAVRAEINTVVDFYRGILGRLPDDGGFNFWLPQFRAAQCQGGDAVYAQVNNISQQFLGSAEYAQRNRNNAQYVDDMYDTFLRRGGDLQGVQFWIGQLDSGAQSREQLREAFVGSPEFNARVQAIVNQGCMQ
jgi:hypothetical protein